MNGLSQAQEKLKEVEGVKTESTEVVAEKVGEKPQETKSEETKEVVKEVIKETAPATVPDTEAKGDNQDATEGEETKKEVENKTEEKVEDGKTLNDYAYDKAKEELIKENAEKEKEEELLTTIPEVDTKNVSEEEAVNDIADGIEKIIEESNEENPDEAVKNIAKDLYAQTAKKDNKISMLEAEVDDLKVMNKELQTENLKLKHSTDNVEIIDKFMGKFSVNYTNFKKASGQKELDKTSKEMFKLYSEGIGKIYPEIQIKDIIKIINDKRSAGPKAIEGLTSGGSRAMKKEVVKAKPKIKMMSPFISA